MLGNNDFWFYTPPSKKREENQKNRRIKKMDNILLDFQKNEWISESRRCPRCKSLSTYHRKAAPNRRCKVCGCEFNSKKIS